MLNFVPVNKALAAFLLVIMLIGSLIDLQDLSKVSMLVNHYREHLAKAEVSFSDFLELHYGKQADRHDKEHGHKSLPFKSHACSFIQPFSFGEVTALSDEIPVTDTFRQSNFYLSVFRSSFTVSIWQPPRLA